MPKIKINDISMYYEIHGEGDPIIFIAGFSVDVTAWSSVLKLFAAHYKVILFDNRGAGRTDVPKGPYSIEQMTDDVADLCNHLQIKQAVFVGNSMGGFIAQTLAVKYPALVKALVISNSTMSINCAFHLYVSAQLEFIKARAPLATIIKASCCWAFSYRFLTLPGMFDQLLQLGLDNPYPFSIEGYEGQYAALEKFNSISWAHKINVPTLVMGGDQDLIFLEASVEALAKIIPNARYVSFKECGHLPQMEYPEKFAEVVNQFINL